MDNYNKYNIDKRAKQLNKVKGFVRQLYTDGKINEANQLWDTCMNSSNEGADDKSISSDSS